MNLKRYLRNHPESFTTLLEGTYLLSGEYTAQTFLEHLAQGPEKEFITVKILE
ncbi:MAG: hypothetical protein K6E76_07765 [Patescibacteria group bacterium]|jgi:cell division protein YceG involved in septum cleavage|nr:hypothetical protein [Patescibacteria group bacterium]